MLSKKPEKKIITKIIKVERKDVCYISHLFEAYEGLAVIRTLDPRNGVLAVWISCDFYKDVISILENLKEEINIDW